jgi:hypothetical protein
MHRLDEVRGVCTVTALPYPVYRLRRVTRLTPDGEEYHDYEWPFLEEEWEFVGEYSGCIEDLGKVECSNCAAVGRMQSLEWPPHQGRLLAGVPGGVSALRRVNAVRVRCNCQLTRADQANPLPQNCGAGVRVRAAPKLPLR